MVFGEVTIVFVSVARGDPDYTMTTNIQLSTDGRPAAINENATTTHVVNGCSALRKT